MKEAQPGQMKLSTQEATEKVASSTRKALDDAGLTEGTFCLSYVNKKTNEGFSMLQGREGDKGNGGMWKDDEAMQEGEAVFAACEFAHWRALTDGKSGWENHSIDELGPVEPVDPKAILSLDDAAKLCPLRLVIDPSLLDQAEDRFQSLNQIPMHVICFKVMAALHNEAYHTMAGGSDDQTPFHTGLVADYIAAVTLRRKSYKDGPVQMVEPSRICYLQLCNELASSCHSLGCFAFDSARGYGDSTLISMMAIGDFTGAGVIMAHAEAHGGPSAAIEEFAALYKGLFNSESEMDAFDADIRRVREKH